MRIPFLDLNHQTGMVRARFLSAVEKLTDSSSFIGGPPVLEFERAFAEYCGSGHCVALNSGTDALRLGLIAAGAKELDEVITAPFTFIATAEAIGQTCRLKLADVEPDTFTLSPESVEEAITEQVRGILPVHIFGLPAAVPDLMQLANDRDLFLIEDACQAQGASIGGKRVGGFGLAASFSFYPTKNLGAFGDAGALTTDDAGIADMVLRLRNHGQVGPYLHELEGFNSRMDAFQAAVLKLKLEHLDDWNRERIEIAQRYREALGEVREIRFQRVPEGYLHVYHLLAACVKQRDELARFLEDRGIETRVIYPVPIHRMPAYQHLGYEPGSLPNAERICREVLCLPLYPGLQLDQVDRIADLIKDFYARL